MSKEEKQIKEITDNDLDTGRDLVTENYQLEILTLKDKVDLRRFSRAFLKVDKLLKNIFSNKLDKGLYGGNAQDLKNDIDTRLEINEAYRNYVRAEMIGDMSTQVDYITIPGKYQCGASSGKYHLSYLSVIDFYPNHKRQIHHDYENGIQWRDKYDGDFSNVPWNTLWDSLNSPKSHVTENRGDKIFTPLGALNLKNWLVENYTTLMTNTRDTLTNLINTKTPHGGYDKTSQDLKNDIDGKLPIRSLSSVISTREWSQLLKIREGTFKIVITYGRNSVVAKGIFLVTIGHNDKANIITLGTHNYSNANFCLRIRTYNNYGFIEMLDIAPNLDSYDTQVINMDIYDVSQNNIFETFSSYTPVKTDGIIACNVRTSHGSMYFNEHRVLHLGDFNPDSKFDRKKIFDVGVPKTFTGACQVKNGSPDYGNVGGGSQHFLIQMSTEDLNESNAYVGQIAFGYSPDNPKIAIRCKTPSKNGTFVELLTKNSIDGLYCPYRVGDIISSTNQANPAATWIGTTWEKLENCFLYGHNTVGARGGTSQINLTVAQLPPHNMGSNYLRRVGGDGSWDYRPSVSVHPDDASYYNSDTIGSGHAIGIMPPYYTVFMWRRTS